MVYKKGEVPEESAEEQKPHEHEVFDDGIFDGLESMSD